MVSGEGPLPVSDATRSLRRALLASFLIYLIPLAGPHAVWFLGEHLWSTAGAERAFAWRTSELGAAFAFQLLAFALWFWMFRRPGFRRGALLAVAAMVLVAAAQWIYLFALPSHFLIEPDDAPEIGQWVEECRVDSVSLVDVRRSPQVYSLGLDAAWLQYPDGGYGVIRAGSCPPLRPPLPLPTLSPGGRVDFTLGLAYAVGERAIFERLEPPTGRITWLYLAATDSSLRELEPVADSLPYGSPVLAADGRSVGWMTVIPGSGPPVLNRVHLRATPPSIPDRVLDLSGFGPAQYVLGGIDVEGGEIILTRNDAPWLLGLDATLHPAPTLPDGLAVQSQTWLLAEGGWVAWDAYQEDQPYRLAWSLPAGAGWYRLPLGRAITSASVNGDGTLIALSATSGLSIGSTPDLLVVFRASDGGEVYRRYLPKYTRTPVLFLAGRRFAYHGLEGVMILRLPEE